MKFNAIALPCVLAAGNDNDSVRPPIINPYKKKAPASAPTSTGVATGRRQNNSTKSASSRKSEFDGRSQKTKDGHKTLGEMGPNPPLRKMFAEFAQYVIEYKKTGKEDDEEEAEILADE
eukprot:scaffold11197_cov143-Skeletonema_marinoi.AAC.2